MELYLREQIVHRLLSNYIVYEQYIIKNPTINILYMADLVYQKYLKDNRFNGFLTNDECIRILDIPKDYKEKIVQLESTIDNTKIELYKNSLNPKLVKKIKETLASLKKSLYKIHNQISELNIYTIEYSALVEKLSYILKNTLYDLECNKIEINNWNKFNDILLYYKNSQLNAEELRELARNEPWSSYWRINKDTPFGTNTGEYIEDQRLLILYSKMYDNIYENPKRPIDEVVQDDDMLDGWMIIQRREREREISELKVQDKFGGKLANSDEIFLPASNIDEYHAINDLNDVNAQMIKKQRMEVIKQKGEAEDVDFPDRQLQMRRDLYGTK